MKTQIVATCLLLGIIGTAHSAVSDINKTKLPDEVRAEQVREMKWGMFICWSFSSFAGQEWTPTHDKDASFFKATGCDTDQWCQTAKDAGMGYILLLAKHHDGFCLWDTKTTEKKVTNSPIGIDVLAKLRKSCDKYGIKLALYFSEGDWNWPGAGDGGRNGGTNPEVKKAQLQELLTQYGPIEFWWIDHAIGTGGLSHQETVQWMHKFQPNTFVGFNHGQPAGRLCLRERGRPGKLGDKAASKYNKDAEGSFKGYQVAEFTYPILPPHKGGAQWFYSLPKHDGLCHPASKVYKDYQGAMQYGNIFSINIGPNYAGKIRDIDAKTLKQVGEMINDDLITHYIEQRNRAGLAADADMLAKQTLSLKQIERIIATDQEETVPARRLIHWRVLHEAQSPAAHNYLQRTLITADPGQAIDFVQSLRFLRGQDIPLLTTLYEQSKSDLVRNALVSMAQAKPGDMAGHRVLLTSPPPYSMDPAFDTKYREYEELAAKAIFLYQQWLISNAKSIDHRRTVYASVAPDRDSFFADALRRETDAGVRRTIYEVLIKDHPGTELLRLLNSDEPESTKLACMKLSLLKIREYKTRLGTAPHYTSGLPETLREMKLRSPVLEQIKAELIEASSLSQSKSVSRNRRDIEQRSDEMRGRDHEKHNIE